MYGLWNGLSWDDWFYLSQQKVGLRYYDNDAQAKNDLANGSSGDACSLIIPLLDDQNAEKNLEVLFGFKPNPAGITKNYIWSEISDRYGEWSMRISPKAKDKIYYLLFDLKNSKSLDNSKKFISDIYNILFYDWICYCVDKKIATSYMLLTKDDKPYDFEHYPLGKFGSGSIPKDSIIAWVHGDDASWSESANYIFLTLAKSISMLRKKELIKQLDSSLSVSPALLSVTDPDKWTWKQIAIAGGIAVGTFGLFALASKFNRNTPHSMLENVKEASGNINLLKITN